MTLLARYARTKNTLDLHLLNTETEELIHVITDAEAEQHNEALTHIAERWATQNGHNITSIDPHILFNH